MVHIKWILWILTYASTSLTSKPLLTIALKNLKTIEKPLVPMVGPPKKHSMVMVQLCQNH